MVDICEFTDDSGVPSRADARAAFDAFHDGELSRDEMRDLVEAYEENEPLSGCVPEPDPGPTPTPTPTPRPREGIPVAAAVGIGGIALLLMLILALQD